MYKYLLICGDYDHSPEYNLTHEKLFTEEEFKALVFSVILTESQAYLSERREVHKKWADRYRAKGDEVRAVEWANEPIRLNFNALDSLVAGALVEYHGFKYLKWDGIVSINGHTNLLEQSYGPGSEENDATYELEQFLKGKLQ